MTELRTYLLPILMGLVVLLPDSQPSAQDFAEVVNKHGQFDDNIFVAGRSISVDAQVEGDVVSFGENVVIAGLVVGDILAAGRTITVEGSTRGDVRVAGKLLDILSLIAGDVMAAGREVELHADSEINGMAWLAGERIRVGGSIGRDLTARGRTITVSGRIAGDADLAGEAISISSSAHISGDLIIHSIDEAEIEPGAEILGDTIFIRSDGPRIMADRMFAVGSALGLAFFVGLFLLGSLQTLLFPNSFTAALRRLNRPWGTLGVGLALLVVGPIAMFLIGITVIGIPITIVLAALFVVALLLGFLVAAGTLGRVFARLVGRDADISFWARVAALAAGLLFLAVVGLIPVVGTFVLALALVFGLGAVGLQAWRSGQSRRLGYQASGSEP